MNLPVRFYKAVVLKSWTPGPARQQDLGVRKHILRPHPRAAESETPGGGPRDLCFNEPSRGFQDTLEFENCGYTDSILTNK